MTPAIPADSDERVSPAASDALAARRDLIEGLGRSWLWLALAMQDIRLRYRGSLIGPFWLTLTTAIMVGAMGILYARLFNVDATRYFPYLTVGLVVWQFVAAVINEGCQTFLAQHTVIQQVRLPFSIHAYRLVCRNLIVLAHNIVIVPVVLLIFGVTVGWSLFLLLPALLVLAVNGVWAAILLGMLSARFRDVPPIVASLVQVIFFVTPVFWSPDLLGRWRPLAELNPLFAAVDIARAPLLGQSPAPWSWPVMVVVTLAGGIGTFVLFARLRRRIAFWL